MIEQAVLFVRRPGPVVAVGPCSNIELLMNGKFHHSLERDSEGFVWVGSPNPAKCPLECGYEYDNHFINRFSENGEIVLRKPVSDILVANGYEGKMYHPAGPNGELHTHSLGVAITCASPP
jgi:hypothetical protein